MMILLLIHMAIPVQAGMIPMKVQVPVAAVVHMMMMILMHQYNAVHVKILIEETVIMVITQDRIRTKQMRLKNILLLNRTD